MNLGSKDIQHGRDRLRRLLPDARKDAHRALRGGCEMLEPQTMLGASMLRHLTEDNLEMLVVYEGKPGAWYADLILKDTPTGVPDTMGTPVSQPLASRDEAEKAAKGLLTTIMGEIVFSEMASHDSAQRDERVFRLYDIEFSIPASLVADMAKQKDEIEAMGRGSIGACGTAMLHRSCVEIAGRDHMDEDTWKRASDDQKLHAFAAMSMMLVDGFFAYPTPPHVWMEE